MLRKHPTARAVCTLCCALVTVCAAQAASAADWRHYGADAASTKFSLLDELDASNVEDLRIVWRWQSPDAEVAGPELADERSRATPIAVDGVLYFSTPMNLVVALDAASGRELWRFDPGAWRHDDFLLGTHRGVSYWEGEDGEARILFGTFRGELYSLDAGTGRPDPAFGDGGRVDLTQGLGRDVDPFSYGFLSPPVICRDVVVAGSTIIDWWAGRPLPALPPPGDVRGFDVRTGQLLWTFRTVPEDGEAGSETWPARARERYGSANAWSLMSADDELGYVYLPTGSVSSDYYGGGRPGDNLYGSSVVCLEARTGRRVWHYQLVHHDLWDYDTPAAPVLVDVTVDGRPVKALAQVTKQGFCFVFDRVTGEPVWPVVERPVPPSTVPGEQASPTQPFPTKPAPFDRQGLSTDDLIDFTPELRQAALEWVADYDTGPLYTPGSERGTIMVPGMVGAANWQGAAADPRTAMLYVPSRTIPARLIVQAAGPDEKPYAYIGRVRPYQYGPNDLPLTRPPYARITAIDLNTGEHAWMQVNGTGPVNHPALRGLGLPDLGWLSRDVFVTLTPTLLLSVGTRSWGGDYYVDPRQYLTARDPATGEVVGRVPLPGAGFGNPITFRAGGRQQVVVPMRDAELVALAVPRPGEALPQQVVERDDADHPRFYAAVAALDSGDAETLASLLAAEPALAAARGYLAEDYEHGSFRGATLLHHVAGEPIRAQLPANIVDLAQALLRAGADADARTFEGTAVVSLVARSRQTRWSGVREPLLRLLVEAGADPNVEGGRLLFDALSNNNGVPTAQLLHELGARLDLRFAAALGRTREMERFFTADGAPTTDAVSPYRPGREDEPARDEVLAEALSFAAFQGQVEAARQLLARGADPNRMTPGFRWPGDRGATALHRAVAGDRVEMVRLLLASGADPSLRDLNWDSAPGDWAGYFAGKQVAEALAEAAVEAE